MSYTPPSGNVADLKLGSGYSAPAGSAADLSFLTGNQAAGFNATHFGAPSSPFAVAGFALGGMGTPTTAIAQQAQGFLGAAFGHAKALGYEQATGFRASQFGTPRNTPNAVGWGVVHFGVGISSRSQPASSLEATQFGAPLSYIAFHPYPIYPATRFGYHMLAGFPRSGVVSTLAATRFGIPRKPVAITTPAHTYVRASTLPRPKLGTPTLVVQPTLADTTGTTTTSFGTPAASVAEYASGFTTSTLGTPARIHITNVSAIAASRFGTPVSGKTYAAAATHKTVFGTPRGFRPGDKRMYSLKKLTRFGRPTGYSRHNYPATAIHTAQLGIPTSFETHHVSMLAPTRRFGKPLLKRSTLC